MGTYFYTILKSKPLSVIFPDGSIQKVYRAKYLCELQDIEGRILPSAYHSQRQRICQLHAAKCERAWGNDLPKYIVHVGYNNALYDEDNDVQEYHGHGPTFHDGGNPVATTVGMLKQEGKLYRLVPVKKTLTPRQSCDILIQAMENNNVTERSTSLQAG